MLVCLVLIGVYVASFPDVDVELLVIVASVLVAFGVDVVSGIGAAVLGVLTSLVVVAPAEALVLSLVFACVDVAGLAFVHTPPAAPGSLKLIDRFTFIFASIDLSKQAPDQYTE